MSAWEKIRFSELGETIRGVSYKPSDLREEASDSAVTLLRSNNIKGGRLNYRDTQFLAKGVVRDNQLLRPQDIAICMSNGNRALVGKAGQFQGRSDSLSYTVGAFCSIFRPNESFDPNFVRHLFGSDGYQKHLDLILAGSAINNLKGSDIQEIEAECPTSKPEQTKIAEILSTVDRAIEQTEALIAKQQRLKTGLMQDLLTRGIDEHGNLRSEQTHQFKDSPLGRIPVEWEVRRLESVSEFVTSGSRGWAQYYSTEGALFLRIGNLTRQHINMRFDDVVRVSPPKSSEGKRTAVMCGDLLISITADLGIIGVIPEGFEEAYVNQHIALVRLLHSEVNPRFVGWFLNSRSGQSQFEKLNESGAKAGLNLPTIKNLLIPKMEIEEQNRIAEILDSSTQKGSDYQQRLAKLRSLKTALMQDLLTGRKRVTALLDGKEAIA